ncbi:hypothetical protein M0804_010829 [Polistes exclamans]|nr:hypothetical protein M0804_010829 [Polistes exclamans]
MFSGYGYAITTRYYRLFKSALPSIQSSPASSSSRFKPRSRPFMRPTLPMRAHIPFLRMFNNTGQLVRTWCDGNDVDEDSDSDSDDYDDDEYVNVDVDVKPSNSRILVGGMMVYITW